MKKIAIILTTYCGDPDSEKKEHMTKTLCRELRKTPYYVCVASHSPLDKELQTLSNGFVYDDDNSFQIDGKPTHGLTHGLAEMKSVHNALNYLTRFKFTHMFKIAYDCVPNIDYTDLIQKCSDIVDHQDKSLVTAKWGRDDSLSSMMFYSNIEFYRKTCSIETPEIWHDLFESQWYNNIRNMNLLDKTHSCAGYDNFLGYNIVQYSHHGGAFTHEYNFK